MGLFSRIVVGIDLGHASIKVVGVALGKQPRVVGFAEVAVEQKYIFKEGSGDPAIIAEALKQALAIAKPQAIHTKELFAVVSEGHVFRKVLELPLSVQDDEMQQVIRAESVEYLPDEVDRLEIDFQALGVLPGDLQQVMVAAVAKDIIENFVTLGKLAHCSLQAIDPKPSAVGRAVVLPSEVAPVILVDVGAEKTSISVYAEHMVWVTSSVNLGLDITVPKEGEEKTPVNIVRLIDGIADEVTHVQKFYQNRSSQAGVVTEIRLSGSGSLSEQLAEALQKQMKMKVVLAKPVISVPEGFDRRFLGALGAAFYPLYGK